MAGWFVALGALFVFFRYAFLPTLSFVLRMLDGDETSLLWAEWREARAELERADVGMLEHLNRYRERLGMRRL